MKKSIIIDIRGQSSVEFIMVTVILIMVVIGILDFSLLCWELNSLNYGAREGARFAVVTHDLESKVGVVEDHVRDTLDAMIEPTDLNITVTFEVPLNIGDPVTVFVGHTFNFNLQKILPFFPESIDIAGHSVMRYEVY